MAATMPRPRVALGELKPSGYNKINSTLVQNGVSTDAKSSTSSAKFNVPSRKFNFTSSIKRSFDTYDHDDQENMDPVNLAGSGKKARGLNGEAIGPRQSLYNLTTVKKSEPLSKVTPYPTLGGVKPRALSPTKLSGLAARNRMHGKRVIRANPLAANNSILPRASVASALPAAKPVSDILMSSVKTAKTSIAKDRLASLRAGRKSSKTLDFVIYEDTPFDEAQNLMQHSTDCLDISDDDKSGKVLDESEKENIPPPGSLANAVRTISRRDMMTEEVRSPLGSLKAADYYATGCCDDDFIIAPQEPLDDSNTADLVDVEFGSIDGELLGNVKSKLGQMSQVAEPVAIAGDETASDTTLTA
ncbi:MAG: hypothetical protein Q9174_004977 [Haloplaca sp. 1 TL-2023]